MQIRPVRSPISRRSQTPHCDGCSSPILSILVLQVVALPVDPTNCDIIPAVDVFTPADVICRPCELRKSDVNIFRGYFSTDLVESTAVWFNVQPSHRAHNRQLESKKETTVDCHNVRPVVDGHKRYDETDIRRFRFSLYEVV